MILGFTEMQEDDKPDESVWLDEPKLLEHFEARQQANREKYGTKANDDEDDWDDLSARGEAIQNELADELLREVIG